jgi:hypothetical protein
LVFWLAPWLFPLLNFDLGILDILITALHGQLFGTISRQVRTGLRYSVFAKIDVMRGISYVTIAVGLACQGR